MDEPFLYKRIAEDIRQEIVEGKLMPGDRLPSIRSLTQKWNCTPGTVQRAYNELAQQGLVISQAGKGTHVSSDMNPGRIQSQEPLRRAAMVHRAEAFLLESLTAGYRLDEIQQSFDFAADRWRAIQDQVPEPASSDSIRFSGSHDMAVIWLSNQMQKIARGVHLKLNFTGSLGGLIALAEGRSELAGCHLWDSSSGTYNIPFVAKLFPGKNMRLIHLANRRLGLMFPPKNPHNITQLCDIAAPGIKFINRQSGSGTRVWLDVTLHQQNIETSTIHGYEIEKATHSEVARHIAEGKADVGIGLESVAAAFSLSFIPLTNECYDLVTFRDSAAYPPLSSLLEWIGSEECKNGISQLRGYDSTLTGQHVDLNL